MLQQGEVWVKRNLIPHLIGELARLTRLRTKDSASHETRLRSLTPREREVVLLIGEGVNNKKTSRSRGDRKSTRLNSSHSQISYAVFCLKKKKNNKHIF